jgi:hypothetical protein
MNHHGVATSNIILEKEMRNQAEYMVLMDANRHLERLTSAYKPKLKLNIFEIIGDMWSIKLQACGDADNYPSHIYQKIKDCNLCLGPIAPSTAGTDVAETDTNTKTIAKMSEKEHIIYHLHGIPRNNMWKLSLELMMDKNAMMTATHDEIVTKLVEKEAAIETQNGLAAVPLLFAMNGGKDGRGSAVAESPKRDKRDNESDNKDDRTEKDLRMCFHC